MNRRVLEIHASKLHYSRTSGALIRTMKQVDYLNFYRSKMAVKAWRSVALAIQHFMNIPKN